jgi:hypothetical protein
MLIVLSRSRSASCLRVTAADRHRGGAGRRGRQELVDPQLPQNRVQLGRVGRLQVLAGAAHVLGVGQVCLLVSVDVFLEGLPDPVEMLAAALLGDVEDCG